MWPFPRRNRVAARQDGPASRALGGAAASVVLALWATLGAALPAPAGAVLTGRVAPAIAAAGASATSSTSTTASASAPSPVTAGAGAGAGVTLTTPQPGAGGSTVDTPPTSSPVPSATTTTIPSPATAAQAVAGVMLSTNPLVGLREAQAGVGNGPMSLAELTNEGRSPDAGAITKLYRRYDATGQFAVGTRIWTLPETTQPGSAAVPSPYLAIIAAIVPDAADAPSFTTVLEHSYLGKTVPFATPGLQGGKGFTGTGTVVGALPSVDQLIFFTQGRYVFAIDLHFVKDTGLPSYDTEQILQVALLQAEPAAVAPQSTVSAGAGAGTSTTAKPPTNRLPLATRMSKSGSTAPLLAAGVVVAMVLAVGILLVLVRRHRSNALVETDETPTLGASLPTSGADSPADAALVSSGGDATDAEQLESPVGVALPVEDDHDGDSHHGEGPEGGELWKVAPQAVADWPAAGPDAAWLPDPSGVPSRIRFWDGTGWTAHVADRQS